MQATRNQRKQAQLGNDKIDIPASALNFDNARVDFKKYDLNPLADQFSNSLSTIELTMYEENSSTGT